LQIRQAYHRRIAMTKRPVNLFTKIIETKRTRKPSRLLTRAHLTDLRGYGRLAADATAGITGIVETLHDTVTRVADPWGTRGSRVSRVTRGLVYSSIRAATWLASRGIDAALESIEPLVPDGAPTPRQQAVRAAINGVYGDHLAATGNPLAIPMRMRRDGLPLTLSRAELAAAIPRAGSRVLVLVHGLCTNDLQWRRHGHDHGTALARDLGYTPIYLHYNSGRHVAENGDEFASKLETLVAQWPVHIDAPPASTHLSRHTAPRRSARATRQLDRGRATRKSLFDTIRTTRRRT
jgi:hypothetical protein